MMELHVAVPGRNGFIRSTSFLAVSVRCCLFGTTFPKVCGELASDDTSVLFRIAVDLGSG